MDRGRFGGSWGRGKFGKFWGYYAGRFSQPPVNIEETDAAYVISLFAAGINKEQVTLMVKDDVLRIAYPGAATDTNPSANPESAPTSGYTYQEYSQGSFERSFQLSNKVTVEGISATYADGVLKVTLPKNPATNIPAQTIPVV